MASAPPAEAARRGSSLPAASRRVAQPGDRICPTCAEPNDPARKFCRRCGTSLQTVAAVTATPWHRRLFSRGSQPANARAAGSGGTRQLRAIRPGVVLRGVLAGIVLLGIVGFVAIPSFRSVVDDGVRTVAGGIRRVVAPTLVPVRPVAGAATSELPDHPAADAVDLATNTTWRAAEATPALALGFAEPFELGAVIVHNGAPGEEFVTLRRAKVIEIAFADGSTVRLDIADDPELQTLDVSGPPSQELTIRIVETYGPAGAPIALAEVELFERR